MYAARVSSNQFGIRLEIANDNGIRILNLNLEADLSPD